MDLSALLWETAEISERDKDKGRKKMTSKNVAHVENGLEDTGRGKGKLGRSERVAWTYTHYQM